MALGMVEPAVELGRRDPLVPDLVNKGDVFHQSVEAVAGLAGHRDRADATDLRQQTLGHLAQFSQLFLTVVDQVPLVEGDDRRPALADDEIRNLQVLLFKRDGRIKDDDHHFSKTDGAQCIGDRKFLELFLNPGLAAHPCGVEQLDLAVLPLEINGDGIARNPGFRSGQQPFLPQEPVDQGRLAGVWAADDGHAQRLGFIIFRPLVVVIRTLRYRNIDIGDGFGKRIVLGRKTAFFTEGLHDGVAKIEHTSAVFGRDRTRFAKSKPESIIHA